MAKIHNTIKAKSDGEMVNIGVGSSTKVIQEWVLDIWETYVIDVQYDAMTGPEFEYFVKSSFKIAKATCVCTSKDINKLIKKRFSMRHGRITKLELHTFLEHLKYAKQLEKDIIDPSVTKIYIQLAIESIKIKTNKARDEITLGIAKDMKGDMWTSKGKAFAPLDSTASRNSRAH